jgi:hypothetical protein
MAATAQPLLPQPPPIPPRPPLIRVATPESSSVVAATVVTSSPRGHLRRLSYGSSPTPSPSTSASSTTSSTTSTSATSSPLAPSRRVYGPILPASTPLVPTMAPPIVTLPPIINPLTVTNNSITGGDNCGNVAGVGKLCAMCMNEALYRCSSCRISLFLCLAHYTDHGIAYKAHKMVLLSNDREKERIKRMTCSSHNGIRDYWCDRHHAICKLCAESCVADCRVQPLSRYNEWTRQRLNLEGESRQRRQQIHHAIIQRDNIDGRIAHTTRQKVGYVDQLQGYFTTLRDELHKEEQRVCCLTLHQYTIVFCVVIFCSPTIRLFLLR